MKPDPEKIKKIYEYLIAIKDNNLKNADGAFVFCRADPLIAERISELFNGKLIDYVMLTGGIGKDSKNLKFPESIYQEKILQETYNIPSNKIYVETKASNGAENSRFGINTIIDNELKHNNLILVVHPTSLRRIYAVHQLIAKEKKFKTSYQKTITNYQFNPENPIDQREAIEELLRLEKWSNKGWCMPQKDLPLNLVNYVKNLN